MALSKAITIEINTTLIISIKTNNKIYNNCHNRFITTHKYKHHTLPIRLHSLRIILFINSNSNNKNKSKEIRTIMSTINNQNKKYKSKDILTFYITFLIIEDM